MTAIGMARVTCRVALVACALANAPALASQSQSPPVTSTRRELVRARESLESGNFRDAEEVYATALSRIEATDVTLRAGALFGHAFARQQRYFAGDTVDDRVAVNEIVQEFTSAAELNPQALSAAAANNAGLVLRSAARHREAKERFLSAVRQRGPQQAMLYVQAGREFETLERADSARWAYRLALAADPVLPDARRSLLELFARSFAPESTLVLATLWRADSASAQAVSDALLELLTREGTPMSADAARLALVRLCDSWPLFASGPSYFTVALSEPLQRAAQRYPNLRAGVLSLADAYAPHRGDRLYVEPVSADWWRRDGGTDGSRATWSAVLRSIGDSYNQRDERDVARSYYEAAVGWTANDLNAPWVDRQAFLPLALLYAEDRRPNDSDRLQRSAEQFTEIMFAAKGVAYRRGDLEQIHDFHLTLGALYAAKGQWTGPGAQNAEFQLEHMRSASRALERTGRTVADPPELLEKLAIRYRETGRTEKAAEVTRQIRTQYNRARKPEAAAAAESRINRAAMAATAPNVTPAKDPAPGNP